MPRLSPPSFKDALLTTAPWALALGFALGAHAGWFCPGHEHSSTTRVEIAGSSDVEPGMDQDDDPCARKHRALDAEKIRELTREVHRVAETHAVPAALVEAIASDPSVLAGQVSADLVSEPHQGFRMRNTAHGSLVRQLGLRDGDIVTHVNGRAMTSVDALMGALASMKGQPQARLMLVRNGVEIRKRFVIR